jgi:hypothetical protein
MGVVESVKGCIASFFLYKGKTMAFGGYLIKVGEYTIPTSIIKADTYKPYISVTDLDSYVDADGYLHRNALEHRAAKIELETVPMLTNTEFAAFMKNIQDNYINATERKAIVSAYIPEIDDYVTQEMYMPDITPNIYWIKGNVIQYDSIRLAFIGY